MQSAATVSGPRWAGIAVFLCFATAFLFQEVYRTAMAVMAPAIAADARLTATDVGFVTSIYFLGFAAAQLPLGILLDRFGPRRTVSLFLLFGSGGAILFSIADDVAGLALGRALLGLGMSCCLMASFKANMLWLRPDRLVVANGGVLTIGALGALMATAPLEGLLGILDWRTVFLGLAAATLGIAAVIHGLVPDRRDGGAGSMQVAGHWRGLRTVLGSPVFWRAAPVAMLTQAMWIAYQGLWAAPWLAQVASLDRAGVVLHLLCLAIAIACGFLVSSMIIDRLRRLGWDPAVVVGAGMALFLLIQFLLVLGVTAFSLVLWVCFGLFGSVSVAFYAILSHAFPAHLAGRVNASLNLLVFVAAFVIQFGVGQVLALWPAEPNGGYPPTAHRAAMAIVLALQLLAFLWFLRPRSAQNS